MLNGIGINKNISGAIRPTGGTAAAPVVWQGNIQFGTSAAADGDNGMVLTTVASAGSYFKVTGNLTGNGWIEQGGGVFEVSGTNNTYSGGTQIGNGGILVDAGSALGPGDVILFQTSTNNPTITLNNAAQTIANLRSSFTGTGSDQHPGQREWVRPEHHSERDRPDRHAAGQQHVRLRGRTRPDQRH